jgi:hypothetical protein
MLEHDREQEGWSVGQAACRLGVGVREYREIEAGERWPSFKTWDRICKLYGWPQTFASGDPALMHDVGERVIAAIGEPAARELLRPGRLEFAYPLARE